MPTSNKYHSSGRIYTAREYNDHKHAMQPTYLVEGYSTDMLKQVEQRRLGQCKPHDVGRNAAKRLARKLGYKSLKQLDRHTG